MTTAHTERQHKQALPAAAMAREMYRRSKSSRRHGGKSGQHYPSPYKIAG